MKIIGYTVGTTIPKPNLAQTDPRKGDYVKNKNALDDRYYTEEEIDEKLSGKADDGHAHDEYLTYVSQELTDEQKIQARTNIGAGTPDSIKIIEATYYANGESTISSTEEEINALIAEGKNVCIDCFIEPEDKTFRFYFSTKTSSGTTLFVNTEISDGAPELKLLTLIGSTFIIITMPVPLRSLATESKDGLMSTEDKVKLDSVEEGAQVNVQSDLSQTDEAASDYVKGVIRQESLPEGYPYEEVTATDISGQEYEITALDTRELPHGFNIPFELGQVWDVSHDTASSGGINTYSGLEVQQTDDGILYLGDINKSSVPFYITTDKIASNSGWLRMISPSYLKLVCVSGGVSETVVHTIDEKYLPDSVKTQSDWSVNDESSIDYIKNRTHYAYIGIIETLPETTIEVTSDELPITTEIELIKGNTYTVKWNGVEYTCVAQKWEMDGVTVGIAVGDVGLVTTGESTGEPFIIADLSAEMAANSGFPTLLGVFDDSTSVTVSIFREGEIIKHLDSKYLEPFDVSGGEYGELLHETTITDFIIDGDIYIYQFSPGFPLVEGRTYIVMWDGIQYELVCGPINFAGTVNTIGLGKSDVIDPFQIVSVDNGDGSFDAGIAMNQSDGTSHTVSIYEFAPYECKLKPECMTDGYVTEEELESKGYLTSIPNDYMTKTQMDSRYALVRSAEFIKSITLGDRIAYSLIGNNSMTQGTDLVSSGANSHAQGSGVCAIGDASHAEGVASETVRLFTGSANTTTYSFDYGHYEPGNIILCRKVVGSNVYALVVSVDTENKTITLDKTLSSTYDFDNEPVIVKAGIAYGFASHSEGTGTTASGYSSHAEGGGTVASGLYSHAEGSGTVANSDNQHAQGKYNIADSNSTYAHIVGNGESEDTRSNAHTLDWDGNAWFAGDVYVGSTSGTNKDEGSVKLIPSPAIATVGQTIRVSAVDENGVPTAWEAVDMVSTDGFASTEYVDEQVAAKQDTLTGVEGQIVGFDADGNVVAVDLPSQDYNDLTSKPTINGVELSGNKTNADLGLANPTDAQVATAVETWLDAHPEATTTVADGSITYEKLDGVEVVANQIFDPVDFRTNGVTGFLNGSTGVNNSTTAIPDEYINYMTSPYMDALPNTDYALNFWPYGLFFYDSDKVMLEKAAPNEVKPVGGTTFYRITTPANAAYIRFCKKFDITSGELETWMICEGGLLFEQYFVGKKTALNGECLNLKKNTVDGAAIAEKTMPANRVKDFDILQQLFNYDDFVNKGVAGGNVTATGAIAHGNEASYHCSDFVPAKAEQVYTTNFRPHVNDKEYGAVACYGADKACLGISDLNSNYQFTTLADTVYIRFGLYGFGSLDVAKSYMICEGTEVFPGYAEGGDQIIVKNLLLYHSAPQNSIPGTLLLDGSIPASKLAQADGLKILCYGDSLTQNLYPAKVATLLNAEVTDAGIGGNTVAQIHNRVGNYGADYTVVTLMCGTNDNGGQTSCPLGTADDEAATDDNATAAETTYASRLKRLLNKIKATHRRATFIIMPPFAHAWGGETFESVSVLMGEIAKQYKMPYLDIYHLCGWDGRDAEDKAIFMADDTHENDVGAQRIAELLAGFIKQLKGA